ncbi:uncharacterized protein [Panulirus ornatus]|uniref:uncharacterized protein isoform X2 n=1 Tax=Panulirus ornatus TaxID=150431 RepID=UPI003A838338
MQSSSIQSISGKVVSKCQLLGCIMVLKNTSLGLCLQWQLTGDHCMKSKEHLEAVIVTEIQTGVRLYPVKMDSLMEKAVFGKMMCSGGNKGTETEPMALLVVCDTGQVMAAHSKLPGVLVILCHIAQPVIWTGILEDIWGRPAKAY